VKVPPSIVCSPIIIFASKLLPEPLTPQSVTNSPSSTWKSTESSTTWSPKTFRAPRTW